jgi:hypothetical protein
MTIPMTFLGSRVFYQRSHAAHKEEGRGGAYIEESKAEDEDHDGLEVTQNLVEEQRSEEGGRVGWVE